MEEEEEGELVVCLLMRSNFCRQSLLSHLKEIKRDKKRGGERGGRGEGKGERGGEREGEWRERRTTDG